MTRKTHVTATCLFGSNGVFTRTVLDTLIENGIQVGSIVLAGTVPIIRSGNTSPFAVISQPEDVVSLASRHGIPIHTVNSANELLSLPGELCKVDSILLACFPYRLPEKLLNDRTRQYFNIHPSLLPAYRGPDPLFWQLHNDEANCGVTLHKVNSRLDAGDIIAQSPIRRVTGAGREELEMTFSREGARLFIDFLSDEQILRQSASSQNEVHATYQSLPKTTDYEISSHWSAEHAFDFIHGTCSPTGVYPVKIAGEILEVKSARDYSPNAQLTRPYERNKNEILIQFSPGVLYTSTET